MVASVLMRPTYSALVSSDDPISRTDQVRFQIERDFAFNTGLYSKRDLHRIVQEALNRANPMHEGITIEESNLLTRQVVQVAQCYKIDPVVFTSLIWRESNFKPVARSFRGAVGLTQMTRIGIHEVLDRLNPHSFRRLDHLRALVKNCNPEFAAQVPDQITEKNISAWKRLVAKSPATGLVMGAILLKLNLALSSTHGAKIRVYQVALERYNGDPEVKAKFALDILKRAQKMMPLPEIVSYDSRFLAMIQSP